MIEAVVQTGAFETSYRRAGAGGPVLLLIGATEAAMGDWLFEQLAGQFRIIAPVLPPCVDGGDSTAPPGDDHELELWLRGLIDGLGLERPALVGGAARGAGLLRFMVRDPERVGRVALVHPVGPGPMAPTDVILGAAAAGDAHPVLVLGLPGAGDRSGRTAAVGRLVRFLAASP
jgi:pimeloyl-ACP methyl ester carboxylesterase